MMRVHTSKLLCLLRDLEHTAKDPGGMPTGILLHTVRGHGGEDVGLTDLLVGTSTNRITAGHSYVEAYGQLRKPVVLPLADSRAVVAAFRPRLTANKEHALEITLDGDQVIIREDPDLFGDGLQVSFDVGDLDKFSRNVWGLLDKPAMPADDDEDATTQPRQDLSAGLLEPFVKVARSRGEAMQLYRYHHRRRILVQIGDRYRGVLAAYMSDERSVAELSEPSGEVYDPQLPEPEGD